MKSLIIIFGALLMIICLPAFFISTHNARVQDYTQTFAGVDTAAGVNSANITLSSAIYDNNVLSISSVTSNNSNDSPSAANWTTTSRLLRVSGLDDDSERTLTVIADVESTYIPAGSSFFFGLSGWFIMFSIIAFTGAAIYAFFDT